MRIVKEIKNGKTDFSPKGNSEQDSREFENRINVLLEAERRGYIRQVEPVKMSIRGKLIVARATVIGGVTYFGDQLLLEYDEAHPSNEIVGNSLQKLDTESINEQWQKCLVRGKSDPSGALTASKTLLESVFKRILNIQGITYSKSESLSSLWKKVSSEIDFGFEKKENELFRSFLGSCNGMIGSMSEIRNKHGDAHGGSRSSKVERIHSIFFVNTAGAMASFLSDLFNLDSSS